MSQEQLKEVEAARQQARLSAEKFEKISQATEPRLPQVPKGRPPESVPHRKIEVKNLPVAKPISVPLQPRRASGSKQRPSSPSRPSPRRSRRLSFPPLFKPKKSAIGVATRPESPANIDLSEKQSALTRLDGALARVNRRYAFHVVHGGSDEQKRKDKQEIQMLENEKRSIQNMKPLGRLRSIYAIFPSPRLRQLGHIARSESE